MNTNEVPIHLSRFTSLPVLLDILRNKHLVLLDPDTWEDRNDAYYIERYKADRALKTVLALCFSTKRETFHHWKVFSDGSSGVCVEFDGPPLIAHFEKKGVECRHVRYELVKAVSSRKPILSDWPFLKRLPYEDEGEFRVIYENSDREELLKPFDIRVSWIKRVTLSPWMPKSVAISVAAILKTIPGCSNLSITRSTLLENTRWKKAIAPGLKTTQA